MIQEISILKKHGRQYIPDIASPVLPEVFRGRPEILDSGNQEDLDLLTALCPTGAIAADAGLSLDLGKCVFCRECAWARPEIIRFTHDYRMAVSRREDLIITADRPKAMVVDPLAVRPEIKRMFRKSLKLRQVSAAGDNSCEMELNASGNVNFDMGRFGIEFVASPRHADGIVITGPVSMNMADALRLTWEAMASPKLIILAGTEAISGGLFAESPAVDRKFFSDHQPDLYIPGNPLHPLSFIHGVLDLIRKT